MSDFWAEMQEAFVQENDTLIEAYLRGTPFEGEQFTSVRELAEVSRSKHALQLPVDAGVRVKFMANIGSVLSYKDPPGDKMGGTVITVRTAQGDATGQDGRVFVRWDDGKFRSILAEHMRKAKTNKRMANSVRRVVADLGDLTNFFAPRDMVLGSDFGADDLVHKATDDLWSFRQEGDNYVIERLFTEEGEPLKG